MLRVTEQNELDAWRLTLEGTLAGRWAAEAERVWSGAPTEKPREVGLRGVPLVDRAGRDLARDEDHPRERVGAEARASEAPQTEGDLLHQLDDLDKKVKAQEQEARALKSYFEDQQALLASAPSIWPVRGWVTSDFSVRLDPYTGERVMHEGLDIATAMGTPVRAPADGTVVFSGLEGGYGHVLVLDHGYGLKTRYGHLLRIDVKVGQKVRRSDVVAAVGNSGRSTGPHLHYEVRVNGVADNPRKFILEE